MIALGDDLLTNLRSDGVANPGWRPTFVLRGLTHLPAKKADGNIVVVLSVYPIEDRRLLRTRATEQLIEPSAETTTMPRTARCLCGSFSVIVSAEPMMVNVCHCQDCQLRSGAPWSSAAYFPREAVHLDGPNKIYVRTSNAGTRINHHFCPTCGSTVCWTRETASTRYGIPVGAFNDPSFPAPSISVWENRRYDWSPAIENVKHWDTQPPAP